MSGFGRDERGQATLGGRTLVELLQEARVATPAYFYDLDAVARATRDLVEAFGSEQGLVAYAVKANTAGSIVRTVAEAGGGADVVAVVVGENELAHAVGVEAVVAHVLEHQVEVAGHPQAGVDEC